MRILVLTTSYPALSGDYKGAFVHDLARFLVHVGHEVKVICPSPGTSAPAEEVLDGVAVVRIGQRAGPRSRSEKQESRTLFGLSGVADTLRAHPARAIELPGALLGMFRRALAEARSSDLLISNWILGSGLVGALVASRTGIEHIVIEHGGSIRLLRNAPLMGPVATFVCRHSQLQHFVSKRMLKDLLESWPGIAASLSRPVTMPMPLPYDWAHEAYRPPSVGSPPSDGRLRLLFAGRLVPMKGLPNLVEAVSGVRDSVLSVAGGGPQEAFIRNMIEKHHLGDRVRLLGTLPRSSLTQLFHLHDCVVVPSVEDRPGAASGLLLRLVNKGVAPESWLCEGTPRILLEGMWHGLVPVASRTGGIPEVIQDRVNGLLCEPGDLAGLVSCLNLLAKNRPVLARMSQAAATTAKQITMTRLAELWAPLLKPS